MKKKSVIRLISILLAAAIITAGAYVGNMFGYFNKGNSSMYSLKNTGIIQSSLEGKTIIFLGSSVTYGYGSKGVSFVDFMEKQDGIIAVKEAKSGTTLVDDKVSSYVSRMKKLDKDIKADAFICQLSTNDATKNKPLGEISDSFDIYDFDTHTVAGAMEYIIAYARQTWDCPIIFYTGTKYESDNYSDMVELLLMLQDKWDIGVIDLWNDETMNSVSDENYKLYMNDSIHPTRAGYRDWWLPVMREYVEKYLSEYQK